MGNTALARLRHAGWVFSLWFFLGITTALVPHGRGLAEAATKGDRAIIGWTTSGLALASAFVFLIAPLLETLRPRRRVLRPTVLVAWFVVLAAFGASVLNGVPASFVLLSASGLAALILGMLGDGHYIELFGPRERAWLPLVRGTAGALGVTLGGAIAMLGFGVLGPLWQAALSIWAALLAIAGLLATQTIPEAPDLHGSIALRPAVSGSPHPRH